MQYRELGKTGFKVSTISFGAWAIGSTWGTVDDKESMVALHKALDCGVNFFDTADVYGDGHSERLLAQLRKERSEKFYVATKAGRRLNPHVPGGFTRENLTAFVERSLKNLETDSLDVLQLHCPPTEVLYMPAVFGILDDLTKAGKLKNYGVSVEKVEEALKAIEYPNVKTIQIIFNMFRQRPSDLFFEQAIKKKVGVLARLPLSSGMLTGKFNSNSQFESTDHRAYNRNGAEFNKGETFSGFDYGAGLRAVESLRKIIPTGMSMAEFALRWILMFPAVTCAIPGAKRPAQVEENVRAADLPEISESTMRQVEAIYNEQVKEYVHHLW